MDFPRRSTRSTLTGKIPEEERGAVDEVSAAIKDAKLEGVFDLPDAEDPDTEDPDDDGEVDPNEYAEEVQKMSEAEKKEALDEVKQLGKNIQLDELLTETEQGVVFQREAGQHNMDKSRAPSREMEPDGMLTKAVKAIQNLASLPDFIRKRVSRGGWKAIRFLIFEYQEDIAEVVDENGYICEPDDEKWGNRGFNLIGTTPYKQGVGGSNKADSLRGILGNSHILKAKIPKQGVSVYDKAYVVPFPWKVSEENEKKWGKYLTEAAKPEKKALLAQAAKEIKATGRSKVGLGKGETKIEVLVWKVSEKCLEDAENGKEETSNHWTRDNKSGQFVPACARKPEDGKPWKTPGEKISGFTKLRNKVGKRVLGAYSWQESFTGGESCMMTAADWPVGTQRLVNKYWVESH